MNGVVVVTGGGSGIGAATAALMAKTGWRAVLVDIDPDSLTVAAEQISGAGGSVETITADVTDLAALSRIAANVVDGIGPIGAVVTSAGIINNSQTVLDMDIDEHDRVWSINYFGTVNTVRAFAPHMIERGRGRSSPSGPSPGWALFLSPPIRLARRQSCD